jgi:branched-chain amino acid aminotransferase
MGKKSNQLLWNGEWIPKNQLPDGLNRAFRYGDGLFESMRIKGAQVPFLKEHLNRLLAGILVLKMQAPKDFEDSISSQIQKVIEEENLNSAILRLWVYRSGEGKYSPTSNQLSFCLQAEKLEEEPMQLNSQGLKIEIAESIQLHPSPFSAFKTLNSLSYIRASIEKDERKFDDLILLDQKGNISEATASNLFLVKDKVVYTPPLSSACVSGVLRTILLEDQSLPLPIKERELSTDDLMHADEVFLGNSIQGIKWVGSFRAKRYFHKCGTEVANFTFKRLNHID